MITKEPVKKRSSTKTRKSSKVTAANNILNIILHCEEVGIDNKALSSCLAVNPKTIQRWKDGNAEPGEAAIRMLDKLESVYQLTARLIKKDSWKDWFHSANMTLGGESPFDLLVRGEVDQVRNVLGILEWGIYS